LFPVLAFHTPRIPLDPEDISSPCLTETQFCIEICSLIDVFSSTFSCVLLLSLFANDARRQLHDIFYTIWCDNIQTARQLRNAVFAKFFDES